MRQGVGAAAQAPAIEVQVRARAARRALLFAAGLVALALAAAALLGQSPVPPADPADPDEKLPLSFVPNAGQSDPAVRYEARGSGFGFHFTKRAAALSFTKGGRATALRLAPLGANRDPQLVAGRPGPGKVNYLNGSERHIGLPTYGRLTYRELWPGVDLMFRGKPGALEYELHVQPGADLGRIGLAYRGAEGLAIGPRGDLSIRTPLGVLTDTKPRSYQVIGGKRVTVASRYVLRGGNRFGFALGASYDPSRPLVIDPSLLYSTFLGTGADDIGRGIMVDASGAAYMTGETASDSFPTTVSSDDTTANGNFDVFVTKLNSTGASLVYSTYLGGNGDDRGRAIAVDSAGAAYVTGSTLSTNYPTTSGVFDPNEDGNNDVFVSKLNAAGTALTYSTLLGGAGSDLGNAIAVDGSGLAYVAGQTGGTFPTTAGALDTIANGGDDAFVTKLNATATALTYSTFVGGTGNDRARSLAIDAGGSAYLTGETLSTTGFPTTGGVLDTSHNGSSDVFVSKLNAGGTALTYSTFLGTAGSELGLGLTIDASGLVYLTGQTDSATFPTTAGAFDTSANGVTDAFVAKLNAGGTALTYSTYLGGTLSDIGNAITIDAGGSAYVAGQTASTVFPTTAGAVDTSHNGSDDAFVAKLNSTGAALTYSTYLGGNLADRARGIAQSGGLVYVTGETASSTFPTTAGVFDTTHNGAIDAFATKLDAAGAALTYSTYLGGGADDVGYGIAVDGTGAAYVTGETAGLTFPAVGGPPVDVSANGLADVFVSKITPAGSSLIYSTYIGGAGADSGRAIAVDAAGAAYVTGRTQSTTFPTTAGAFDTSLAGSNADAFVAKLNAAGTALTYSTYIGAASADTGHGIAVDSAGAAYVAGQTGGSGFPATAGAFDTSDNGSNDAFVAKLNAAGSALTYATLVGAAGSDLGRAIAIDATGAAYLTGDTSSTTGFPTTAGGFDTSYNGGTSDVYIAKLNATGTALVYSTLVGASTQDAGLGIAADAAGAAYVTGQTDSATFPTTPGALDTSPNGGVDTFVSKLNAAGTALDYSTMLGGNNGDIGNAITVDGGGAAYVTGSTTSGTFPVTAGALDTTHNGGSDAFVSKLNAAGTALTYSTFLGGNQNDVGRAIAQSGGLVYVTGDTTSANFPTVSALDTTYNGGTDAFVSKLDAPASAGYPRPKGATPFRASLVPAYKPCAAPNTTHGPPDLPGGTNPDGSCAPPVQESDFLTVGTPDAPGNAKGASSTGFVVLKTIIGNPATTIDEADISVEASVTDVRNKTGLTDYTGELQGVIPLRITDRDNGGSRSDGATVADAGVQLAFTIPCVATPAPTPDIGSACALATTADAIVPASIRESDRAVWQLGQTQVLDGGSDGVASTTPNTVFARQGVFVP